MRRQHEIEHLVMERRDLKEQWRKVSLEQRVGINLLQKDINDHLATLQRAENLRIRCKKKERAQPSFYHDPFRFVKGLLAREKSRSLKMLKRDLEDQLKTTNTDEQRNRESYLQTCHPSIKQNINKMSAFQDGERLRKL